MKNLEWKPDDISHTTYYMEPSAKCPICKSSCNTSDGFKGVYAESSRKFAKFRNLDDFWTYCYDCCILFGRGCFIKSHGCEITTDYVIVIKEWTYKGITYNGMIKFDNIEEVIEKYNEISVKPICMCVYNGCTYNRHLQIKCTCTINDSSDRMMEWWNC